MKMNECFHRMPSHRLNMPTGAPVYNTILPKTRNVTLLISPHYLTFGLINLTFDLISLTFDLIGLIFDFPVHVPKTLDQFS